MWVGYDAGECHCNGKFTLVTNHRHQLNESLKAIGQHSLGQCLKLRSLLQDLRQHLHERRTRLRVAVVAQA